MKNRVITFDGTYANKADCKLIQGTYYIKDKQCFLMPDNKWHRINNGKITHDYRLNKKVFISDKLNNGIVGTEIDGSIKFGYFTPDPIQDVDVIIKGSRIKCLNEKLLSKENLIEDLSSGTLFYEDEVPEQTKRAALVKKCGKKYNLHLDYRCNDLLGIFTDTYNKYNEKLEVTERICNLLPDLTFGIEYETNNGYIPERHIYANGLIPVRDGSLKNMYGEPYEYATIILKGKDGISAIKKHCELLNKYCENSYKHSLHVHVGNIPVTKLYVVSIYLLSLAIQDELFSLFPKSYRHTGDFKKRDYNMPLPNVVEKGDEFNSIFKYLSMGKDFDSFGRPHPADPNNNQKWNVETRYHLINLTTLVFNKNQTVEFRIHPSTFNQDKIINWIFITLAICKFADNHKNDININKSYENIKLKDILQDIYGKGEIYDYLNSYIQYRKNLMVAHEQKGDILGLIDSEDETAIMNDFENNTEIRRLS